EARTNADTSVCVNSDRSSGPHPVIYGATFVNPTAASIFIDRVEFSSSVDHFTPPSIMAIAPAAGTWTLVDRRHIVWTGHIEVPTRSARDFIFGDSPQNGANNSTRNV